MESVLGPNHVAFLSRPLLCKFASISRDGSPHVTPTWFLLEDGKLIVTTPVTSVKAKNVSRDPRVTLLFDEGNSYAMVRGIAKLTSRDYAKDVERMSVRYEGPEVAKTSVPELLKEVQVSIEITPTKVVSLGV